MNKSLLLLTMLAVAGALGLTDTDETRRSSVPLRVENASSGSVRPRLGVHALPAIESHRAGHEEAVREQALPPEEAPAEYTDALVLDELARQEAGARVNAESTALDWEDPYGGNWHDQGGGP